MADATGPQCLSDWNHTEADYGQQLVMCSSEIYLSTGCPKKMLHSDLVIWNVDKPAMFGYFWSKMDHFWAILSHERWTPK